METLKYLLGITGPSGFGSRSTAEEVTADSPDLRSITAVITGATSGIGFETARVLAMRGARLFLPARSLKAAQETSSRIKAEFPEADITVLPLDLSSLTSVRTFVTRFESLRIPLNLLINNAGRFPHEYGLSEDGFDMTFATNYLGHFLLTKLLTGKMVDSAEESGIEGRIVIVTSSIHSWFSGDGFEFLRLLQEKKIAYDGTRVYSWSKLANVLHTKELAGRLTEMEAKVSVNCVHPGVVRTGLTRDKDRFFTDLFFFLSSKMVKSIPQAAATTCYVATSPRLSGVSGRYFADCNEACTSKRGTDGIEASRLWTESEAMVGGIWPSLNTSTRVHQSVGKQKSQNYGTS